MITNSEAIIVNNLTKDFKGFKAVDGISFEVKAGEIFGFLGPNGAGKTTTVKMLCTLLHPSAGNALVAGYDILRQQSLVRKSIGIIFQDPSLDDRLTAYENLRFHGIIYKVPNKELPDLIHQSLEWMELSDRANDLVRNFSGGMKRRLEIARGLLHSPKVLFLDEPTLGLDPQTRNRIWEYLIKLRREKNITLFLTTHYMDEAEYCDRIAIIDYGKIIALDTPKALKAQIKNDVVDIQTADDLLTEKELLVKYNIKAKRDGDGLHFEVPNGAEFVPKLVRELTIPVKAVTTRRPTLDDVFLKLTGREIRDESASSRERLKSTMRRMGRAWR
ncbi:MAG: ATP-binding cassette domain-containing protein [candidate division WOR-3 bacterium]